jgi:hypothetical protein
VPGGFIDLTVRFTATSGGAQNGTLVINTNDADEPEQDRVRHRVQAGAAIGLRSLSTPKAPPDASARGFLFFRQAMEEE